MRIFKCMHKIQNEAYKNKEIDMAKHENKSFAEFCARQKAGLLLISEAEQQENDYQKALKEAQEKRFERKYQLFYDNLDLILCHRDEILATPALRQHRCALPAQGWRALCGASQYGAAIQHRGRRRYRQSQARFALQDLGNGPVLRGMRMWYDDLYPRLCRVASVG